MTLAVTFTLSLLAFAAVATADNCSDPPAGADCQGTVGHAAGVQAGAAGVAVGVGVLTAAMAGNLLGIIQETARKRGYDDIWKATLYGEGKAYNPDGSVNVDYVRGLRDNLVRRIGRDLIPSDDRPKDPFTDFVTGTWHDATHNTAIRIGAGILSGGSSEIFFQSQAAWEAMQRSFDEAIARGQDWDLADALRAGYGQLGRENLPVNLIEKLNDPNATWTDIALAGGMDIFTVHSLRETFANARGGLQGIRNGDVIGGLTHREPIDFFGLGRGEGQAALPIDDVPGGGRNVKGLSDGAPVHPVEFGMPEANARAAQAVAEKYGVTIDVRPTNPEALARLAQGDLPKPEMLKSKTMNDLDVLLGAPPEHVGRAAFFEPTMPSPESMSWRTPAEQWQIQQRFNQRMNEFHAFQSDMRVLQSSGDIRIENGVVVDGQTGKYFTGDHDIFNIRDAQTGLPVDPARYNQAVNDLANSPFGAQHGANVQWQIDPFDPHADNAFRIRDGINSNHSSAYGAGGGGNTPLISFGPGRPPQATYFQDPAIDAIRAERGLPPALRPATMSPGALN